MTVRIDVKGFNKFDKKINKTTRYITNLNKNIDTRVSGTNKEFMERVRKLARMRAPKDTGALKKSIRLEPVRKGKNVKIWKVVAGNDTSAPHAIFQEEGFKAHLAPIMNSAKLSPGVYMVSKNTPFLGPAVDTQMSIYSQKLDKAVTDAIIRGLK